MLPDSIIIGLKYWRKIIKTFLRYPSTYSYFCLACKRSPSPLPCVKWRPIHRVNPWHQNQDFFLMHKRIWTTLFLILSTAIYDRWTGVGGDDDLGRWRFDGLRSKPTQMRCNRDYKPRRMLTSHRHICGNVVYFDWGNDVVVASKKRIAWSWSTEKRYVHFVTGFCRMFHLMLTKCK